MDPTVRKRHGGTAQQMGKNAHTFGATIGATIGATMLQQQNIVAERIATTRILLQHCCSDCCSPNCR